MEVTVVGAGLAGSECAFQLAEQGVRVRLLEQKPVARTEAQQHDFFAELVCSNSLRSADLMNAVGLLKEEMRRAGSLVLRTADATAVPAGGALAVDRERFGPAITRALCDHPNIRVVPGVVERIPEGEGPVVLATGPLTGAALAEDLARTIGEQHLAYYDAIAPIVSADSLDWDLVFRASRYDKGGDDAYVNCPLDEAEYTRFVRALIEAEKVPAREFEKIRYFEGCLPVEVMAERGVKTLSFGPMKPVGLSDPRTGRRPYAVLQLRAEDEGKTAYNLVGCQTRMKRGEQRRVFGMVPGLARAEFLRFGSVHRNTFVCSPRVLGDRYELATRSGVYLAGQVSGVEGYVESAASGLVIGLELGRRLRGQPPAPPPPTTALGALMGHLRRPSEDFQPSNVVWSMFPEIQRDGRVLRKRERKAALSERALSDLGGWLRALGRCRAGAGAAPRLGGEGATEAP